MFYRRMRLQIAQENERIKLALDDRERKLQTEMSLVSQQQLIHERLVDDVAKSKSARDQTQAELNNVSRKLGAADSRCETLAAKIEQMNDYEGRCTFTCHSHVCIGCPHHRSPFGVRLATRVCCIIGWW
jgi:hypothetical protein